MTAHCTPVALRPSSCWICGTAMETIVWSMNVIDDGEDHRRQHEALRASPAAHRPHLVRVWDQSVRLGRHGGAHRPTGVGPRVPPSRAQSPVGGSDPGGHRGQHAVHEAPRVVGRERRGQLDRLVQDHRRRHVVAGQQLGGGQPQDVAVDDGHAVEVPADGRRRRPARRSRPCRSPDRRHQGGRRRGRGRPAGRPARRSAARPSGPPRTAGSARARGTGGGVRGRCSSVVGRVSGAPGRSGPAGGLRPGSGTRPCGCRP